MLLPAVVEPGTALDAESQCSAHDREEAHEPRLVVLLFGGEDRHEVGQLPDTVFGQETGDQHVGLWPVKLFVVDALADRGDLEVAPFVVVENTSEDAGGVEPWEAEPVDRPVDANKRDRPHVSDYAVVLDRPVSQGVPHRRIDDVKRRP